MASRSHSAPGDLAWLLLILVVAAGLRAWHLNAGLWYDEVDTLVHHARQSTHALLTTYPSLNHHVLFTLQAHWAMALFGESPAMLRLPAFLFGVGSVWALWLLAREIVSPWEARLAALLMAVSYHHVWFSQNARGYTGLLFWGLVATWLLLRAARTGSLRTWTAFALCSALALHTHLTAAFLVASQALVCCALVLVRGRSQADVPALDWRKVFFGFALTGVLALALYAPMIPQIASTFGAVKAGPASAEDAAAIAEWKSLQWMVVEVFRSLGPVLGVALPAALVVILAGAASLARRAPLVPLVLFVHVPLTLAILVLASMRVWPRYFFADIGFLCLLLVHGAFMIAGALAHALRARAGLAVDPVRAGILLASLGVAASLVLLPRNYQFPKQDFVGARDFVEAHRGPDAAVVTIGLATLPFATYYAPHWGTAERPEDLEALRARHAEVWLVYAFPAVTARRFGPVLDYADRHFTVARRLPGTLGQGDLIVLRSRPGA